MTRQMKNGILSIAVLASAKLSSAAPQGISPGQLDQLGGASAASAANIYSNLKKQNPNAAPSEVAHLAQQLILIEAEKQVRLEKTPLSDAQLYRADVPSPDDIKKVATKFDKFWKSYSSQTTRPSLHTAIKSELKANPDDRVYGSFLKEVIRKVDEYRATDAALDKQGRPGKPETLSEKVGYSLGDANSAAMTANANPNYTILTAAMLTWLDKSGALPNKPLSNSELPAFIQGLAEKPGFDFSEDSIATLFNEFAVNGHKLLANAKDGHMTQKQFEFKVNQYAGTMLSVLNGEKPVSFLSDRGEQYAATVISGGKWTQHDGKSIALPGWGTDPATGKPVGTEVINTFADGLKNAYKPTLTPGQ